MLWRVSGLGLAGDGLAGRVDMVAKFVVKSVCGEVRCVLVGSKVEVACALPVESGSPASNLNWCRAKLLQPGALAATKYFSTCQG